MARPSTLVRLPDPPPPDGNALPGDRIDFDAWLLPPEQPTRMGQGMHLVSAAAGPVLFIIALACTVAWIA
jgi:hypothetical protein